MASYTSLCPYTGNADMNASSRIGVSCVLDTPTNFPYVGDDATINSVTASFYLSSGTSSSIQIKCEVFQPSGSSPSSLGVVENKSGISLSTTPTSVTFTGDVDTTPQGVNGIQIAFILILADDKEVKIQNNDAGCTSDTGAGQSYYTTSGTFTNYKTDTVPITVTYTGAPPPGAGGTRLPPPPLIARF